ncbi:hypothetical protein J7L06_04980 [Candidatus Bathyarchaeota archaeon]|nr:hypothetical protein [Candidatus Bathyarchaeota archaeon]
MGGKGSVYREGNLKFIERVLTEIPGFRGYKEKKLRRESDKLLRKHLYRRLIDARSDLKEVFQKLSDYRRYELFSEMNKLIARLDRVAENVNHASYGYTGFFNVVKVEEEALDRMIEFDGLLVEYVNEISKAAAEFKESIRSLKFGEAKGYIEEVGDTLEALEEKFSERMESILEMKH